MSGDPRILIRRKRTTVTRATGEALRHAIHCLILFVDCDGLLVPHTCQPQVARGERCEGIYDCEDGLQCVQLTEESVDSKTNPSDRRLSQ